ncbi:MAG TPA: hypothetical protein VIU85_01865 [Chthoniobacterales bacterium]
MSSRLNLVAGAVCFVSLFLLYGITSRGKLQASDEAAVFASGISLATTGHLNIDQLKPLQERVNLGAEGPDGHLYTKYFPGNVFAVALVYKLTARENDQPYVWTTEIAPSITGARWALCLNAFWGALAMTALLFLLRRFFDWPIAIATVIATGVCSDWLYQSRGLYSEVAAGALVTLSLFFLTSARVYSSSALLALSMLFRPTTLLALPFIGAVVKRKLRPAILSALIIALGLFALAVYNYARFGSPFTSGYPPGNLSVPLLTGLSVLLFSPGRSIFVYSPILLLAIPGAWFFFKKEKALALSCIFFIVAHALIVACWGPLGWGLSWGSRLMTLTLPVFGLLVAAALDRLWKNKWLLPIPLLLGMAGLTVNILALLRDPTHVLIDHVQSGDVQFEETIYSVRRCWLALQIDAAQNPQPCETDSHNLRRIFTSCPD